MSSLGSPTFLIVPSVDPAHLCPCPRLQVSLGCHRPLSLVPLVSPLCTISLGSLNCRPIFSSHRCSDDSQIHLSTPDMCLSVQLKSWLGSLSSFCLAISSGSMWLNRVLNLHREPSLLLPFSIIVDSTTSLPLRPYPGHHLRLGPLSSSADPGYSFCITSLTLGLSSPSTQLDSRPGSQHLTSGFLQHPCLWP